VVNHKGREEMEKEKDYIYIDKVLCDKLKAAESEDAQLSLVQEYLEATKKSMSGDLETMEEDAVHFKGMLLSYKKAYREALEAHNAAVYKTWEDIDGNLPNMKAKVEQAVKDVDSIIPHLDRVMGSIGNICQKLTAINTYELEKMVKLIETIQGVDEKTKDVLSKLLGN
jgi:uncharacterized protein YnzC (UPF0291/DUF896 family)